MDSKYVEMILFLHGNLDLIPQDIPKLSAAAAQDKIPGRLVKPRGRAGAARRRICAGGPHRRGGGRVGLNSMGRQHGGGVARMRPSAGATNARPILC